MIDGGERIVEADWASVSGIIHKGFKYKFFHLKYFDANIPKLKTHLSSKFKIEININPICLDLVPI